MRPPSTPIIVLRHQMSSCPQLSDVSNCWRGRGDLYGFHELRVEPGADLDAGPLIAQGVIQINKNEKIDILIDRIHKIEHLVYASTSSVYGANTKMPFSEHHSANHPLSVYAASKKSNELMAHTYSHLYQLPTTGLRFFTVYGPWGRPDMALFLFTKSILKNEPINVFNKGEMIRDFTFVDDVIESIIRILNKPATPEKTFNTNAPNPSNSWAPHRIFNIGNSKPTQLIEYIQAIEEELGIKAKKRLLPMQLGDVAATASDSSQLQKWIDFKPNTTVKEGIKQFIKWYKEFYGI